MVRNVEAAKQTSTADPPNAKTQIIDFLMAEANDDVPSRASMSCGSWRLWSWTSGPWINCRLLLEKHVETNKLAPSDVTLVTWPVRFFTWRGSSHPYQILVKPIDNEDGCVVGDCKSVAFKLQTNDCKSVIVQTDVFRFSITSWIEAFESELKKSSRTES